MSSNTPHQCTMSAETQYRFRLIQIQQSGCECDRCINVMRMLLEEIDKLKPKPINNNITSKFEKIHTNAKCCICMDCNTTICSYNLPCGHNMHVDCLDVWFTHNHTCPICRADFNKLNE